MRRNAMAIASSKPDIPNSSNQVSEVSLHPKKPVDSEVIIHYNFTEDEHLRDMYADHKGGILIGKLFEDLDALAGNIAHSHCDSMSRNLVLVTASVDKIIQTKPIPISGDIILTGRVAWVGTSSLDILIEIQSTDTSNNRHVSSEQQTLFSCFFTYVARSKITNKAAPVNKLSISSESEQKLFRSRQLLAEKRKKASIYTATDPTIQSEISRLLEAGHAVQDMPALAHPNAVLMKSTVLENSLVCQPQNTNSSGRVFGGFLSKCMSMILFYEFISLSY